MHSSFDFDQTSNIWLQPFSALINCMFPVEYVYADWLGWQTNNEAQRADPECLTSPSDATKEAGSRVEGFCIPQLVLRKSDIDHVNPLQVLQEHWQPDRDTMTANDPFVENNEKKLIPIFTAEHAEDDPRYAKLRLTKEWKDHRPRYKNVSFLHHSFLLPSAEHSMKGLEETRFDGQKSAWSYDLHGPVRKLESGGFSSYEEDQTGVFKYPIAWPEPAMEWLIRQRPSGWPSPELIQEIFDAGCHLAPVGRGKRADEPVETLYYCQKPELSVTSSTVPSASDNGGKDAMDETEWRISFSLAENRLGESVTPVQRHVMVLLKMIKKFYFPDVISTYYLKNLLFWECEKQEEVFWKEENSANCLLFLLDRLQECLKAHHLPHYIMPESNLLQYEDPASLKEAAVIVGEVRSNILPKTVSLLKRLQSMSYLSSTYLKDIGLQLEGDLLRMQEQNHKDQKVLLRSLHSRFVGKCKDVIASIRRIQESSTDIERELNVALNAYQSILARNLYKLWQLDEYHDESEDEFKSFVKKEVKDLSFDDAFLALALVFLDRAKNGAEPSLEIPTTRVMKLLREEQMQIAKENVEEGKAQFKGILDLLKRSDLKDVTEKLSKEFQGKLESTEAIITQEDMERLFNREITAIFQERMKDKQ
ncbi:cyclic GMP-AMP synthase-like receptor 2 [Oculina patagonica]